jgi:peptidoglycan/xylan/chitin deacetylase (PgdA/CDA1 family)
MTGLARRSAARAQLAIARRSAASVGLVLVYHEIRPVAGDHRRDLVPALSVAGFREQLAHMARHYEAVALGDLPSRLDARAAGDRVPVALTFDDDLACHVEYAAPALADHDLPATFFLTGRSLDGPDPFWWQDLEALGRDAAGARLAPDWPWARRAGSLHALGRTIEDLTPAERDAVAASLRGAAEDRGISAAAARQLVGGGFEIGFHTRRHDPLPPLADEELARAMDEGREALAALTGGPMTAIAYPHGRADLRVSQAAAQAGYAIGLIWTGRATCGGDPPLLIDRIDGWAASVDVFAWHLARAVSAAG